MGYGKGTNWLAVKSRFDSVFWNNTHNNTHKVFYDDNTHKVFYDELSCLFHHKNRGLWIGHSVTKSPSGADASPIWCWTTFSVRGCRWLDHSFTKFSKGSSSVLCTLTLTLQIPSLTMFSSIVIKDVSVDSLCRSHFQCKVQKDSGVKQMNSLKKRAKRLIA